MIDFRVCCHPYAITLNYLYIIIEKNSAVDKYNLQYNMTKKIFTNYHLKIKFVLYILIL